MIANVLQIDQQADGQEEHDQQDALDRFDHRDDPVAERRIADHQPSNEGSVGGREADQARDRGGREAHGQGSQRQQLDIVPNLLIERHLDLRSTPEPPQQRTEQSDGKDDLDHQSDGADLSPAKRRNQNQHGNDGDVLRDQYGNGDPAGHFSQRIHVVEHLHGDHRARQRDDEAEDDAFGDRRSGEPGNAGADDHRRRQLPESNNGGWFQIGDERLQRKFRANEEQENEHTHFGQRGHVVVVFNKAEAGRPHDDPGQYKADERRLTQAHQPKTRQNRNDNDNGDLDEWKAVVSFGQCGLQQCDGRARFADTTDSYLKPRNQKPHAW